MPTEQDITNQVNKIKTLRNAELQKLGQKNGGKATRMKMR